MTEHYWWICDNIACFAFWDVLCIPYIDDRSHVRWLAPAAMSAPPVVQSHTVSTARPCQLFVHLPNVQLAVHPHDADTVEVAIRMATSEEEAQEVLARRPIAVRTVEQTIRIQPNTRQQPDREAWWRAQRRSDPTVTVEVHVPAQTNADVHVPGGTVDMARLDGQITVEATGGTVDLHDMAGRLDVQAFHGDVVVEHFSGPLLSVRGTGRTVDLRAIETRETHLHVASCTTHLQDIQGDLSIEMHGGATTGTNLRGPLSVEAHGGSLSMHTPPRPVTLHAAGTDVALHLAHGCRLDASAYAVRWNDTPPPLATCTDRRVRGALQGGGAVVQAAVVGSPLALALP